MCWPCFHWRRPIFDPDTGRTIWLHMYIFYILDLFTLAKTAKKDFLSRNRKRKFKSTKNGRIDQGKEISNLFLAIFRFWVHQKVTKIVVNHQYENRVCRRSFKAVPRCLQVLVRQEHWKDCQLPLRTKPFVDAEVTI